MLSIIFVYLYDYFYDIYSNNAYIIESSIIEEVIENDKEELLKRESETNPVLNFSIEFYDNNFNKLSENFIAREINGKETQLATADSTSQHVRRLCHLGTYGTVGKRRHDSRT
jgi:hypothetical protein